MSDEREEDFLRLPGLYRLWDLQRLVERQGEFQVHFVEDMEDGTPLFAVYHRLRDPAGPKP